jgi:hypothetical protein
MPRNKNFSNLTLLEQVEYLVKKQLPKEAKLQQTSLVVSYSLTVNVATEDNPFELTSKTYEVVATYDKHTIKVSIKDGEKLIKEETISLNINPEYDTEATGT